MNKRFINLLIIAIVTAIFLLIWQPPYEASYRGKTMGTTFHIKWIANRGDNVNEDILQNKVDTLLKDINAKMSTYIPSSELSLFNKEPQDKWFKLSADTHLVLKEALEITKKSQGAFDPTVGPLISAWGFGATGSRIEALTAQEVSALLSYSNFKYVVLDNTETQIKKLHDKTEVDLSAIAKGYAVDRVVEIMNELKIENYMVEIGGEVSTRGINLNETPWQIAIENPDLMHSKRKIHRIMPVSNIAMATSGTYRNYFDDNGKEYSHIINPVTGFPVTHKTVSVSVLHESCMISDAWATALLALGAEKGLPIAEKHGLNVLFLRRNHGKIEEISSKLFTEKFGKQ